MSAAGFGVFVFLVQKEDILGKEVNQDCDGAGGGAAAVGAGTVAVVAGLAAAFAGCCAGCDD